MLSTSTAYLSQHVSIESAGFSATTVSFAAITDHGRLALAEVSGLRVSGTTGVEGCPEGVEVRKSQAGEWIARLQKALRGQGLDCWN